MATIRDDFDTQQNLMQSSSQKSFAQRMLSSMDQIAVTLATSIQTISGTISDTLLQEDKFSTLFSAVENATTSIDLISGNMDQLNQNMGEINRRVVSMVEDVLQVTQSITDTTQRAVEHNRVMQDLSKTVAEGQKQMQNVLAVINVLYESVDAIKEAIAAINDISDQTNLLAMNAAIEAAHAGKAGLGFAVVAGEIRKLSAVTRMDSANIEKTLKGMMDTLSIVHKAADESRSSMKMIETQTSKTMEVFSGITEEMSSLSSKTSQMKDINSLILTEVQTLLENTKSSSQSIAQIAKTAQENQGLMNKISVNTGSIVENSLKNIEAEEDIINLLMEAEKAASSAAQAQEDTVAFPFARVLMGHLLWVIRVRELVSGKSLFSANDIPDSHSCVLGKWIDTTARRSPVHELPVFSQLVTDHEELHNMVIDIFKNISILDREEKEKRYASIVEKSIVVIEHLQRLREVGGI